MAYSTPPTFVAGDILEAAQLNVLGENDEYLYGVAQGVTFSGVELTRAAATSIPNTTDTTITWSAEISDLGGWYTSGTDIVVPAGAIPAGFTTIAAIAWVRGQFAANGTGYRTMRLSVNGTPTIAPTFPGISGDTAVVAYSYPILGLEAGDVITVDAYQNSGGSLNVSNSRISLVRFAPMA